MSNTLKFGNGEWYGKEGTILAYNDENNNYKPLPFTFDRDSVATRVNKQGLIETVGADQPRVDYLNDSNGALLLEPSRTNNLLRSEEFDNASWTKFSSGTGIAPVVTANYTTSPDGSNNADRVVFDKGSGTGGSDLSQMRQIVSDVGQGVSSVYIKSNTSDSYTMGIDPVGNATLITITPEWQRFTYSETTNDRLSIGLRASQTSNYADVSIWGAQMEAGSYATSYIKTEGSAVTRLADVCVDAGNEQVINSTEGVLYAEIAALANDGTTREMALSDGGASNRIEVRYLSSANDIQAVIRGAASTILLSYTLSDAKEFAKVAVKYKSGDYALWIDGVERAVSTTTGTPTGLSQFAFDDGNGGFNIYSKVKDVRVYNTALTDQELAALTQV